MKTLLVSRSTLLLAVILTVTQFACGAGSTAPGSPANLPTNAPPPTQGSSTGQFGTPAEAQAMLALAIEHYQTAGRAQALADFTAKKAPFGDRDLYVVCLDSTHVETANGGFPTYVGQSADLLRDAAGNPLGKAIWDAASAQAQGSIQYDWINPVSNAMEHKVLFYQKLDQDVCGVGAYSQ